MKNNIRKNNDDVNEIYATSEYKANKFNLMFLCLVIVSSIVVIILNLLGVFTLANNHVIIIMILLITFSLIPNIIFIVHDRVLKIEPSILKWNKMKYLIFLFTYLAILIISISISYHATL